MRIRDATPEDAEAIERIRVRGWQAAYRGIFPRELLDAMQVDWSRRSARIAEPPRGCSTLVGESGGRVAGFAATGPDRDDTLVGELYGLYVDPDSWSAGVGRALLSAAEVRLGGYADEATLWVLEANGRARRFYELGGWREEAVTRMFVLGEMRAPVVRYRKLLSTSTSRS